MATLTITIPDDKLDRVKTALGNGTLLTNAQARAEVIVLVKNRVIAYEQNKAEDDNAAAVMTAQAAQRAAGDMAAADAEAIAIT